jgi:hypothetical protein
MRAKTKKVIAKAPVEHDVPKRSRVFLLLGEYALPLLLKVLQVSLWGLGISVWLYRIAMTLIHGQFFAAALWLVGSLLVFALSIPPRCLLTLYAWATLSACVTFTPWGIKIGVILWIAPVVFCGLSLAWEFVNSVGQIRTLLQDRVDRQAVWRGLQSLFLVSWIGFAFLFLGLPVVDLCRSIEAAGWQHAWISHSPQIISDIWTAGLLLLSIGAALWRLGVLQRSASQWPVPVELIASSGNQP